MEWPSPTPGSVLQHGIIEHVLTSPGGSERVTRSKSYQYKRPNPNSTTQEKESRDRGRRQAKQRAKDFLDPDVQEAKRRKRRKLSTDAEQAVREATPGADTASAADAEAQMAACPVACPTNHARMEILRDWEILRASRQLQGPAAVLDALRMSGLVDESRDEWSVFRVQERVEFLRRCVRVTASMIGTQNPLLICRPLQNYVCMTECVLPGFCVSVQSVNVCLCRQCGVGMVVVVVGV